MIFKGEGSNWQEGGGGDVEFLIIFRSFPLHTFFSGTALSSMVLLV